MSKFRRAMTGVLLTSLLPASAAFGAAKLTITPTYVQSLNPTTFEPAGIRDLSDPASAGFVHQIDVKFQLDGLDTVAPSTDFGFAIFNAVVGQGLTAVDFGGGPWNGFNEPYDSNGSLPGGSRSGIYSTNSDGGGDLQAITVIASNFDANNRQLGETPRPKLGAVDNAGYPTLMGTVYVQWNGQTFTNFSTQPILGAFLGLYENNANGDALVEGQTDATFESGSVVFGVVPEPASLSLLGLGAAALFGRRRRK